MNTNIKLMATDLDGTLLDTEKNPPADFEEWVTSHEGIRTVLASGRQYYTLKAMFNEIDKHLIYVADNGGLVFVHGEILYCNPMLKENLLECIDKLEALPDLSLILCGAKAAYMKHSNENVESNAHMYYASLEFVEDLKSCIEKDQIVKIAIFVDHYKAQEVFDNFPALDEKVVPVLSGDSWIDISNRSVSKGEAIRAIQDKYKISREESAAFGDYLNDYDMLLQCAESYAMKNAHQDLKKVSKYVTEEDNDHDGVMKVIRNW